MTGFLKILSVLIVAAGAFLLYGAGFLAKKAVSGQTQTENRNYGTDGNIHASDSEQGEHANNVLEKTLSFKRAGVLLIMLGGILVLMAFR